MEKFRDVLLGIRKINQFLPWKRMINYNLRARLATRRKSFQFITSNFSFDFLREFVSAIACVGDCNMLITAGGDKVINFCDLNGEVKRKDQKIKKIIDFIEVIERPLSLYKSSLSTDKVTKKHQFYTTFKK